MRRDKHYLYLDGFEHRLAVAGMNLFLNRLIQAGKPAEDVDVLLLKLLKPHKKNQTLTSKEDQL